MKTIFKRIIPTIPLFCLTATTASAAVRYVDVNSASPTPPYTNWSTAATNIQDAVNTAVAGDEIVVTNGIYATGGVPGNARVTVTNRLSLRSVNGPQFTVIRGGSPRCAYLAEGASLSGFTLTNGSSFSGALFDGGGVFCLGTNAVVSNCVLVGNSAGRWGGGAYGGTLINCTLSNNSAWYGGGAASLSLLVFDSRGVLLRVPGCRLINCTLSNNSASDDGGGAYGGDGFSSHNGCELINCRLTDNWADFGYGWGGGAMECKLNQCVLTGNHGESEAYGCTLDRCVVAGGSSGYYGAKSCTLTNCSVTGFYTGARSCTLNNCTLTRNNTGASASRLNNCIAYDNWGWDYDGDSFLSYCCTKFMPANGIGNITERPRFSDEFGGDLRLAPGSPCINAGNNIYVTSTTSLDGRLRIIGGNVDIGAYEFQGPFDEWLQQNGLATDGSADFADSDGDGLNSWQEWIAGTVPTNAASVVRLLGVTSHELGATVSWMAVSNGLYFLERATNLGTSKPFSLVASNLAGLSGMRSYTDTSATGPGPYFYRIGVQTELRPFAYTVDGGAITITSYTGGGGMEVIPSTINGLPVTSIGNYAFHSKSTLTNVTIPESVTNIGVAAFFNCIYLTNVTINGSLISIGDYAFASCYNLIGANIPETVISIGDNAFAGCSRLASITIPDGLVSIGNSVFAGCHSLTDVTFPNGVTNIGASAFSYCSALTNIVIPGRVIRIGDSAFSHCSSLSAITIPDSVMRVGDSAFSYCSSLSGITIPDSVETLGAFAFLSCTGLTSVMIGNGLTTIPYQAFSNCTGLASVVIPDSVVAIEDGAFQWCTNLADAAIGNSVEWIGRNAFSRCSSLASITIPDNVTDIADWAFFFCSNLGSVTIGDGVATIGKNAFANCGKLTNAILGSSIANIGSNAFSGTSLPSINIPGSVTNIGAGAFAGGSSLSGINVDASNPAYSSIDGVLFNQNATTVVQCPGGKTGSYAVPDGVLSIGPGSFGSTGLTRVTIPNSVTNIGAWAFSVCWGLTNVTVGNGVTYIGDRAFYYCDDLLGVYFLGNAPVLGGPNVFISVLGFPLRTTVYYVPGTVGWGPTYGSRPTATWSPPASLISKSTNNN